MWSKLVKICFVLIFLTACLSQNPVPKDDIFAPGIAGESNLDGLEVGHRMMAAGEFELALRSYTRAAAQQGLNVDTLSAIGSANLRLGRLGQAEDMLRRATEEDPSFAAAWNNLGVILMEKGDFGQASQIFRRAFATDNGNSDQIRENLRIALANLNDPVYGQSQTNDVKLVRRGVGDFVLLTAL